MSSMNGSNSNKSSSKPSSSRLAEAAAVAGMLALVAVAALRGSGAARGTHAAAPGSLAGAPPAAEAAIYEAIEIGADHVSAVDLADRLLAGEPILLIDLRPAVEHERFHLPGALSMTVPELLGAQGAEVLGADRARPVVLYSNGPGHPGQAWVELARRGFENVRVLDGGLDAFRHEVLTPATLRGPVSEARARAESRRFAAQRAFFLGGGRAPGAGAAPGTRGDAAVGTGDAGWHNLPADAGAGEAGR